jgi:hypothetical protein
MVLVVAGCAASPDALESEPAGEATADISGCSTRISSTTRRLISDLGEFWGTEPALACIFRPSPGLTGACGELHNDFQHCPKDDSIKWTAEAERRYRKNIRFVMGHEWGHLNLAQRGLRSGGTLAELHADCQLGVYCATQVTQGELKPGLTQAGRNFLCRFSGNALHGGCAERMAAFDRGVQGAQARSRELVGSFRKVDIALEICGRSL